MCAAASERHFQFSQRAGEDSTSSVQKGRGGSVCFSKMVTGMINVMIHVQCPNWAPLRASYSQSSDEIIPSTGTLRSNHKEFTHLMCRKRFVLAMKFCLKVHLKWSSPPFFSHLLMISVVLQFLYLYERSNEPSHSLWHADIHNGFNDTFSLSFGREVKGYYHWCVST